MDRRGLKFISKRTDIESDVVTHPTPTNVYLPTQPLKDNSNIRIIRVNSEYTQSVDSTTAALKQHQQQQHQANTTTTTTTNNSVHTHISNNNNNNNNNQDRSNGGSIKKTPSSGRRLSIKQDQLSVDSIC
uniref:Uncharacterized protein n=1 Tax=Bactrocera dorsalis TaxID=27457 RepID=A0A034VZ70_BACDO